MMHPARNPRHLTVFLACAVLGGATGPGLGRAGGPRERAFDLIAGGEPTACIVASPGAGSIRQVAVARFNEGLRRDGGVELPVVQEAGGDVRAMVIIGTPDRNALLSELDRKFDLKLDALDAEGFLVRTLSDAQHTYLVIAGGGDRGVLYGVEEVFDQVVTGTVGGDVYVTPCNVRMEPALAVRGTYCLTCWGLAPRYDRAGWEAAIDSMAAAGMNRVMFWMDGLFRSRRYPYAFLDKSYYSGVQLTDEDIHKLIRYAHDRGMTFYFGSGVFGWFTSGTFSEKFKEAVDHTGHNLCPSHPVAQKHTLAYLEEMYELFPEADGYMLEIRDEVGDCMCDTCQKPLDEHGSKQFGQSELDLLDKLSARVWRKHPQAKFVWLIGYGNHKDDVMYYERIRRMGRDPRMEWLEVRGSWTLPTAEGARKPLTWLSDRAYMWGGGYYAQSAAGIQGLVRRILREGLTGYLPAYEPGFGTSCIYGKQVPYPVHLVPFNLTQFYYRTFTWQPEIDRDGLVDRAYQKFFTSEVPREMAEDLLFLRDFNQTHHVELTCVAPGLIRTNNLGEGVEQIWGDSHMPDKAAQLGRLAKHVRALQELGKGGGDMARIARIEEQITQYRPRCSRRSAATLDLMEQATHDLRAAIAQRHEDLVDAPQTLERINARIKEYLDAHGKAKTPEPDSGWGSRLITKGPISVDAPIPDLLLRLRLSHVDLQGSFAFLWYELVNSSAIQGFPGPVQLRKLADDTLELSGANELASFVLVIRAVEDGMDLELTVRNLSDAAWPATASIEPCISPRWPNLPGDYRGQTWINRPVVYMQPLNKGWERRTPFHDNVHRRHTFIVDQDGQLAMLDHMGICFADQQTREGMSADEDAWIAKRWNGNYPPDPRHPARGVLVRRDPKTGWVFTCAWDQWTHLKTHDVYDCLHVAPRLGPLAPGESKTLQGRIRVFQGTMEEALRRTAFSRME